MKKKMNPRISASQAKNIIMMGRSGRMLGLDGDESASVVLGDADTKSVPKGRIGAGGILKVKLQLGNLIVNGSPESDPYIDLFSRDLSCRADSSGRCGIKVPTNLDYFRWVHFFEPNPGRLRQIVCRSGGRCRTGIRCNYSHHALRPFSVPDLCGGHSGTFRLNVNAFFACPHLFLDADS